MSALITGIGSALPAHLVANDELASMGKDDHWIVTRTGVRARYHLRPDERLADLAVEAARASLDDAGLGPTDIDMFIVATSTPDRISPGLAPELAHLLGAGHTGAIDMNGACTGFLYALDYAMARVEQGTSDRILVVGAEAMSRITDRSDPTTAFLFGDGAGAVVIEPAGRRVCPRCAQYLSFGSAGAGIDFLFVDRQTQHITMDGAEVYIAAVEAMSGEIENVLLICGLGKEDIDYLVCHQANARIVNAVARELGLPNGKALSYIHLFGNTSSASIPIALSQAQNEGLLLPGKRVMLAAFGAGFTWGAGVINWKGCRHNV